MENVILVIHLLLALSIIGLVLLQRSEGGGLGIGGGGGGMGSFASAGQTANVLTRATAICAGLFFITSLILAILAGTHHRDSSILDDLDAPAIVAPVNQDAEDVKGSTTPTNEHGDDGAAKLDSSSSTSDKDLPKAEDKPQPQSGAPSAPISE